MDKEKLSKIVNSAENATNNDLITAKNELKEEFEKTKTLIIELTRHLDTVADMFEKVHEEHKKRFKQ